MKASGEIIPCHTRRRSLASQRMRTCVSKRCLHLSWPRTSRIFWPVRKCTRNNVPAVTACPISHRPQFQKVCILIRRCCSRVRFSERDGSGRRYVAGHLRQSYRDRGERRGDVHAHPGRAGGNHQPIRELSLRQCDYCVRESGARCRWISVWSCRKRNQCLGQQRR